jgi:AcrR family transcriptional regulator
VARKRQADSAETLERIINATHAVLENEGLDAISLRKVAREAGVSVGTVGYYFTSADALWDACLEAHYERVHAFALRYFVALEQGGVAREILPAAVRDAYFFALDERPMLRLVLALSARRGGLSDRHRERRAAMLRGLAARWPPTGLGRDLVLGFQTLVYATARYACSSVEERLAVTGAATEAAADEAIARHLAQSAKMLLLPAGRA